MAHFGLENDLNSVIRMDAPLARAPLMRWQRKMATDSLNASKSDSMINCSSLGLNHSVGTTSKTPMKTLNISQQPAASNSGPSKTPGKSGQNGSKTPSEHDYKYYPFL
jgi:hypothetical protein